jgi:hypothetical protein
MFYGSNLALKNTKKSKFSQYFSTFKQKQIYYEVIGQIENGINGNAVFWINSWLNCL